MVLWGTSWDCTQYVVPLLKYLGTCDQAHRVIKWLTTLRYWLSHLQNPRWWKNGPGLRRFSHYGTLMGWKPHRMGNVPHGLFTHRMEDIAVAMTQTLFRDEMHPSSPWMQLIEALNITLLTLTSPSRVWWMDGYRGWFGMNLGEVTPHFTSTSPWRISCYLCRSYLSLWRLDITLLGLDVSHVWEFWYIFSFITHCKG